MNKQSILYKTLCRALSIKRPHMRGQSPATAFFTDWLFDHVPECLTQDAERVWLDSVGNLHVDARKTTAHRTLFVAHVDTVHKDLGPNKIRKTKHKWYADGAPLGADDGAGCAMLMHLIHNHIPAYYIFTQGEECGGIGAKFLADNFPGLLSEFDRAIAFDRRGIDSVISHQGYGRCCSDKFAQALADELNAQNDDMMYSPDNTGVYTDTAEFTDIIPECTNISVGYDHEHSDREELDVLHFQALANAVVNVRWDELPTSRNPLMPDPEDMRERGNWLRSWYPTISKPVGKDALSKYADNIYLDTYEYQPTDEDDDAKWDTPEMQTKFAMFDAIEDARMGKVKYLITLMAELVYPQDPDMAEKFMDRNKLTEDMLDTAEGMLDYMSAEAVACELFDEIYAGA